MRRAAGPHSVAQVWEELVLLLFLSVSESVTGRSWWISDWCFCDASHSENSPCLPMSFLLLKNEQDLWKAEPCLCAGSKSAPGWDPTYFMDTGWAKRPPCQRYLPLLGRNRALWKARGQTEEVAFGQGFAHLSVTRSSGLLKEPRLVRAPLFFPWCYCFIVFPPCPAFIMITNENLSWLVVSNTPNAGRKQGNKTL